MAPRRFARFCALVPLGVVAACGRNADANAGVDLTGAGATFPYPLYRVWFANYGARAGVRINYLSVGSSEGLRLLNLGQVDFGAMDRPLSPSERGAPGCGPVAVPTVAGPIAVVYNLSGLSEPLHVDAAVLAHIFSGRVTRWNATEVSALNPGVRLPPTPIIVVHRGLGSGTGLAFATFLSQNRDWTAGPTAADPEVHWPVGRSAEGNEGAAAEVKESPGAIGYVELAYARQNLLQTAAARDSSGAFVLPGASAASAYPIVARTWLVIDPRHTSGEKSRTLTAFVRWALREGAEEARTLEYLPLPPATVTHYDSVLRAVRFGPCTGDSIGRSP